MYLSIAKKINLLIVCVSILSFANIYGIDTSLAFRGEEDRGRQGSYQGQHGEHHEGQWNRGGNVYSPVYVEPQQQQEEEQEPVPGTSPLPPPPGSGWTQDTQSPN